ncbi:MAG TPA: hypothetical protein VK102_02315 [Sphingobacterium sp.]|nr:hypothetical protein [Sphingobacterium sp.]
MKKILNTCLIAFLFLSMVNCAFAQEKKLLQFSGIISATGSELPVPYATITNKNQDDRTFAASYEGYFSFVAQPGDTIRFSSVGYEPVEFVIPDIKGDKYSTSIKMPSLVKELPAVTPYPWASIEEFNLAFMALSLSDDDIATARKNLSPEALASLSRVLPRSAEEIHNFNVSQRHIQQSNKAINQNFANPLFSPFAWGSLINSIRKGDFSRNKLKY